MRDLTVTGVQAWALPICAVFDAIEHARAQHDGVKDRTRAPQGDLIRCPAGDEVILCLWEPLLGERLVLINIDWTGSHTRSEERSEGKECRFRWQPYH